MSVTSYRQILAVPRVTRLLCFAVVARLPNAAASIVITLYVVLGLGKGYAAAGLVGAAWTVGIALGSPWRGRLLDKVGVRRAVLPSVVVEGAAWGLTPLVGYRTLLLVALVGGLFTVPTFTVVRQALAALVPPSVHHSAFALDSIATELTYMVGPSVGVLLATTWSSTVAILAVGAVTVLSGVALMVLDPPITSPDHAQSEVASGRVGFAARLRLIFAPGMAGVLIATVATLIALAGTEVSVVAHLREDGASQLSWVVFVAWSLISMAGGLLFGALSRPVPLPVMLLALGALTVPMGLVPGAWWLVLAILPAGFFCAGTLSASAAASSGLVPESLRGEAMGWYGTATTVGMAVGAPLAGVSIDLAGAGAGFAVAGAVATLVAIGCLALIPLAHDRPGPAGPGAQSGVPPTRRRTVKV